MCWVPEPIVSIPPTETSHFSRATWEALNSPSDGFESSELILTCDKMEFFFLSSGLPRAFLLLLSAGPRDVEQLTSPPMNRQARVLYYGH